MSNPTNIPADKAAAADISWLEIVEAQVLALKYGSVEVTVHEGRVV